MESHIDSHHWESSKIDDKSYEKLMKKLWAWSGYWIGDASASESGFLTARLLKPANEHMHLLHSPLGSASWRQIFVASWWTKKLTNTYLKFLKAEICPETPVDKVTIPPIQTLSAENICLPVLHSRNAHIAATTPNHTQNYWCTPAVVLSSWLGTSQKRGHMNQQARCS